MVLDAWLPVGFKLPDEATLRSVLFAGAEWQIFQTEGAGRALIVHEEFAQGWVDTGLVGSHTMTPFQFGSGRFVSISSGPSQVLCPVAEGHAPRSKSEALAFALALKATRAIDPDSPLQDALYVERLSRLLPTHSISSRTDDDVILGFWLTGGAHVSVHSFRRLRQMLSWMGAGDLKEVIEASGFDVSEVVPGDRSTTTGSREKAPQDSENYTEPGSAAEFELPGRPELESFFNEHVIDIVQNRERYRSLGLHFPSAIVLHGPPGTGKTFAVERLTEFLGWPSFQVDASSIASPYIHETSRKVSEIFEKAMENSPSVLVIDEMEAFLGDRNVDGGHHRVEEVAEFLRRIPEATKNEVLVVAMTNRIDMVDAAILRRGRFDHVINVGYATEVELRSLLKKLLSAIPKEADMDPGPVAEQLAGQPLSDVAFVVREAARMAARAGKDRLDQESLLAAAAATPGRDSEESRSRIGFV